MQAQNNMPKAGIGCHRCGFEKECLDLVARGKCNRWISVDLVNAQTGEKVSQFDCVDNWTPFLLVNQGKLNAETTASVDKMHNFMAGAIGVRAARRQIEDKAQ